MQSKVSYSLQSLNSSCATDDFSFVASSPFGIEDDDGTEDSDNNE